ncbi:MAG TPA: hypothetical protein VEB61_04875 [Candidatus Binatia bacterium]|nr:hypothetical protein [Candidatus Binatia bacterium]
MRANESWGMATAQYLQGQRLPPYAGEQCRESLLIVGGLTRGTLHCCYH